MRIIGVIGQNGSGKDEVLKYLRDRYGVPFLSTGDIVREIAAKEDKKLTRENLWEISQRYFREFGKGCFVKMAVERISQNGWAIGGITGIRSLDDVRVLKSTFGKDFVLINVYVSGPKVRYERMLQRGEEKDPQSYEQFLRQDKTEEELFHIKLAEQSADYTLANDGLLEGLYEKIDGLIYKEGLLTS